jgi:hypothetical protein
MIDICAVGPLRISSALYNNKCLNENAKIAMITSQGNFYDFTYFILYRRY